jgi:RimJ/RimL family protein N-acetyltransferase
MLGLQWAQGYDPLEIPAQPFIESLDKAAGMHLFLTRDPEEVVGYSRFEAGRLTSNTFWISYGVAERRRSLGFATEGVGAQVTWLGSLPGVEFIKADVHRANEPSRSVLKKLGFTREQGAYGEVWLRPTSGSC